MNVRPPDPNPAEHSDSVRFVYEQLLLQRALQDEQRKTFADKAVALLASSLVFGSVITTEMPWQPPAGMCLLAAYVAAWCLYILAGVSLLAAALAAIRSLWPRSYRYDPLPRALHEKYRFRSVAEGQSLLSGNLMNSYEHNERVLETVNRWLKVSFISLSIGLVSFLLFVLVRWPVLRPG